MKKEFKYYFQITKLVMFEVKYYTLGNNENPYFATEADKFFKNKRDYECCGQAQDELLPKNSIARQFWEKWDKEYLKDLSDDKYNEVVKDIEELKEKYNYIEYIKDTFKVKYEDSHYQEKVFLSKADLKNKIKNRAVAIIPPQRSLKK